MTDEQPAPQRDLKPVGTLAALGLYAVVAPPLGLATLFAVSPRLEPILAGLPVVTALILVVMLGVVLVGSALLPSIGFAGYVGYIRHGDPWAYMVVVIAILGATYVGLAWARRLSSTAAQQLLRTHPKGQQTLDAMEHDSSRDLMGLVFMSRLSPHMPFAFTNILIAQLHQPLSRLVLVSTLGLLPRSLLAVAIGGGLGSVEDWTELPSPDVWAWGITAVVVLYFGRVLVRAYRRT